MAPKPSTTRAPLLVGIPYDGSSSWRRGSAAAPDAIRNALKSPSSNSWSESLIDIGRPENLGDVGDLDLSNADVVRESIERGIRDVLAIDRRPISLGGDHSITYPIVKGFGLPSGEFTILQIDAHGDLYSSFQGDRYSHACPFARILESGLIRKLVQVGIRTLNDEQKANAEKFNVDTIDMRAWAAGRRPEVTGPLYVSIDVDGIDPAFAPGVSHREPGGLTVRDVVTIIQGLPGPIVGADVVEYNPSEDQRGVTGMVCAKLVKELAARMIETG